MIAVFVILGILVLIGGVIAVGLGMISPNRGLEPRQIAAIDSLVEAPWEGQVRCGDELRGITVEFERQARGGDNVAGTVTWHDGDSVDADVLSTYRIRGTFDGVRLRVEPDGGITGTRAYPSLALVGDVANSNVDAETDTVEIVLVNGGAYGDDACQEFWFARYP